MNKVYLKRFMKDIHNDKKAEQENKYIKYDDRYLISNNCSVVLLNSDYGVLTENNGKIKDTIKNIYEDFRDRFCLNAVDITDEINNFNTSEDEEEKDFKFKKEYACDIKEEKEIVDFGIDLKKLEIIKKMIKADKIEIHTKFGFNSYMYVIEIKNTKTNEIGYLLPIKIY